MSQQQQRQERDGGGGGYDPHREQQSRSIRAGTQVVTKSMSRFVTSPSSEGLYHFDLDTTYSRIRTAAKFIKRTMMGGTGGAAGVLVFSSKDIARESLEAFCEETGTTPKTGRFMPGTLTNPSLSYYTEPTLVVVSDPQADAQAVTEATNAGVPVVGISSTEGMPFRVDVVIPANNRDRRALEGVYKRLAEEIGRVAVDPAADGNAAAAAAAAAATGRDEKEAAEKAAAAAAAEGGDAAAAGAGGKDANGAAAAEGGDATAAGAGDGGGPSPSSSSPSPSSSTAADAATPPAASGGEPA